MSAWHSFPIAPFTVTISCVVLLFAGIHDIAVRTVPNVLPAVITICGIVLRLTDRSLGFAWVGLLMVFFATALCWRCGWFGGGDVKLLSASALLVSPAEIPALILSTAIAGGVLALAYLAMARLVVATPGAQPARFLARVYRAELWRIRRGAPLPYACAIATGAIVTLLNR